MQESFATILVLYLLRFAWSLLRIFKNSQTTGLYDMQLSITICQICGALRDLVLFVQFEKREKHPSKSVTN